jgi:Ca2+-binding RTX toxin-like protein
MPDTLTAASRPDQILIRADPTSADHGRALAAVGGRVIEVINSGEDGVWQRVQLGQGVTIEAALEILSKHPGIDFAERDWQVAGQDLSNDTAFLAGQTWGLYGDLSTPANAFGSQAAEVWATGNTGSSKVAVGVIDTGVDYTHPDLYLNIWLNFAEIPTAFRASLIDADGDGVIGFRDLNDSRNNAYVSDLNANGRIDAGDLLRDSRWENGVDNDANGFIDDLIGWDFVNNDNDPMDDRGHGTHVAGTIGAVGGNGTGVAGVAWNVQIVALKFLNSSNQGFTSDAVRAADYFTNAGRASTIIDFVATNNSWGGGGYSQALLDAIIRGAQEEILFVAAAGNNGANNDVAAFYPSNYSTLSTAGFDAVIAVAAIGSTGSLASWSNFGMTSVDLAAPGASIYSTTLGGGYGTMSGTSMATPHVTGAIALFVAAHPNATPAEIRGALLGSVITSAAVNDRVATDGRLDAASFVGASAPPPPPPPPPPPTGQGVVVVGTDVGEAITPTSAPPGQPFPGANADTIQAGGGADTLDGGAGADSLVGGAGHDRYDADDPGDTILELPGGGNDHVFSAVTFVLPSEVERLTLTSGGAVNGIGNALANFIWGGSGDNLLDGGVGNDNLQGSHGADTLLGGQGADTMNGGGGNDFIDGGAGADSIIGGTGADTFIFRRGEAGGDVVSDFAAGDQVRLVGFAAGSAFVKAAGNTTDWIVTDAVTGVAETIRFTNAYALSSGDFLFDAPPPPPPPPPALGVLVLGTAAAEAITPSSAPVGQPFPGQYADTIQASGGGDTLDGGTGADSLVGGTGSDHYYVDDAGDLVLELAGEGEDQVFSTLTYVLPSDVERLKLTSAAAVNGTGNGLANVLTGGAGDNRLEGAGGNDSLSGLGGADTLLGGVGSDTLDGESGADSLAGGTENDFYLVDDTGDVVMEFAGEGDDLVLSAVTYTLLGEVERLTLTSAGAVNGFGNGLANVITGGTGENSLNGAAGDDSLAGNGGADTLAGGVGSDTLDGGSGADSLAGGAESDFYLVDDAGDVILELAGEGDDLVLSGVTYVLPSEVERLTLTSAGAVNGTGNGLANVIIGGSGDNSLSGGGSADTLSSNAGADTLDGGTGADSLAGGAGADQYLVDDAGDVILELAGEGDDLVLSSVTYVLPSEVERLTLTSAGAVNGTGNGLANVIIGGSGDNSLNGGGSADTLLGNAGADVLDGGPGADSLVGGAGHDRYDVDDPGDTILELPGGGNDHVFSSTTYVLPAEVERLTLTSSGATNGTGNSLSNFIWGSVGDNVLEGLDGNDNIQASQGTDTVLGGQGADTLFGGGGNDSIDGGAGADSIVGGSGNDVLGFRRGEAGGDIISDFAPGDHVRLIGFAAGSTFVKAAGSNTDWIVTDAATGVAETIRFANAYALSSGDFLFA